MARKEIKRYYFDAHIVRPNLTLEQIEKEIKEAEELSARLLDWYDPDHPETMKLRPINK